MHVGSSSPTRDRILAPCIGSAESYPLDHRGSPKSVVLSHRGGMGGGVQERFRNLYSEELGYNKNNNHTFQFLSSFYMLATLESFMYIL